LHQDCWAAAGERGASGDAHGVSSRDTVKSSGPSASSSGASTPHGVARKGPNPCRRNSWTTMVDAALRVERVSAGDSAEQLEGIAHMETGCQRRMVQRSAPTWVL
jgi:hypothetical protein